jgi:hypothetical protein
MRKHGTAEWKHATGLLSAKETSKILGICQTTLRNWTRQGRVASVVIARSRRWRLRDVERLIDDSTMLSWWPISTNGGNHGGGRRRWQRRRGRVFGDALDDEPEADDDWPAGEQCPH